MSVKHGDFSALAANYSQYRPDYSETVLTALLSLVNKPVDQIDFVDVGAGTGLWTRMAARRGCRSIIAIEPNDEMRRYGEKDSNTYNIVWKKGSGEDTYLQDNCCDLLTMASSFHWTDFETAVKEFYRILRARGRFSALWNPRDIEANPLLVEIENKLYDIAPHINRVSSGRSGITNGIADKLLETSLFKDIVYIEGRHTVRQTPEQYIGVWWSVNDIRAQAGEDCFNKFMNYVKDRVQDLDYIETTYLTRAWSAQKN